MLNLFLCHFYSSHDAAHSSPYVRMNIFVFCLTLHNNAEITLSVSRGTQIEVPMSVRLEFKACCRWSVLSIKRFNRELVNMYL
jgi:hypothetical protein